MSFEDALRQQLGQRTDRQANRLRRVLDQDDSVRRRFILRRWENAARGAAGIPPGRVDWAEFDWKTWAEFIFKLLIALLVLL